MRKVVLAGGTGFIGEYFKQKFQGSGYNVFVISRKEPNITWNDKSKIIEALEGAEILINLAGKSVNCRYNQKNRKAIMDSRINTTSALGDLIKECDVPPKVWFNSSTATIYRHAEDRQMTEDTGEIGSGFSVDVATAWEKEFFSYNLPKTRQVALRIAIVLGKGGGVMTPYQNLVKFGLGGVQGSGNQMFSWIHIEDLFRIVNFIKDREELSGVFNCSAPGPISNRELMRELREKMNRSFGLSSPKWMLELGSVLIRTETELVLKSRWVVPERLEQEGYQFKYHNIRDCLTNIIN